MITNDLAGLRELTQAARARADACSIVDASDNIFLSQLGRIDELLSQGVLGASEADAQRRTLIAARRIFLQGIAAAPESQLSNILHPAPVGIFVARDRQAADVIAQAEALGIKLCADSGGSVEASPAARLTAGLRQALTMLRAEIAAILRADVFVVPG